MLFSVLNRFMGNLWAGGISSGLSVSNFFDTLPGGIPYPLDTPQVPDETSGDTPGFAPRWARVVV